MTDATHVYWIEHPTTVEGYNGNGIARVLRTDKLGATEPSHTTVLATGQTLAVTLALDGPWIYWTVYEVVDGGQVSKLRRVPRECGPTCPPPEEVAVLSIPGQRMIRLLRFSPGVLFGVTDGGHVYRFVVDGNVAKVEGPIVVTSYLPSFVATDEHVYAAGAVSPNVARVEPSGLAVAPAFFTIPPDGGQAGVANLWTDCSEIWATRGSDASFVRIALADGGLTTVDNDVPLDVYDMAGDADYLYIAEPNLGLYVMPRAAGAKVAQIYTGKVFRVAVDAEGVYWGEHTIEAPAAGTIYMLVK
jgi:hypothetical protein